MAMLSFDTNLVVYAANADAPEQAAAAAFLESLASLLLPFRLAVGVDQLVPGEGQQPGGEIPPGIVLGKHAIELDEDVRIDAKELKFQS